VSRAPARLTYVSCHPAALARDLRELAEAFAVESLVLVDLFPQTGHVEIVLQMVRRA
jgi:tRNA/tmRNA/rRNA uracil-C5-methylase (TrmA/RlmC/RlmD family)